MACQAKDRFTDEVTRVVLAVIDVLEVLVVAAISCNHWSFEGGTRSMK
jgi:hypothetical protein